MKTLLILIALLIPPTEVRERTVGHNVQFFITKDHRLSPVLPMSMRVEQETGGIVEGVQTCDLVQRDTKDESGAHQYAILKCKGGVTFKVTGWSFTESK